MPRASGQDALTEDQYFATQRIYYPGFTFAGIAEPFAIIAVANPTGAVTRNVFANDVRLVQNTTTPGNGDEPGYALTVEANGSIRQ